MEDAAAARSASSVEDLLARSEWIRNLAASLARDPDRAEDLAQSTIALALEKGPREGVPVRRWIAAVMRNLVRQDVRSQRRREAREARSARPEADFRESALVERLDVQRAVVEAVRALDEPFRSAVLMRYFEGLAPADIAARAGVPIRTVHSRLHRALRELRERLDAEHGGRSAWLPMIVALSPSKASSSGAAATLLASTKVQVALGVAGAAVLLAVGYRLEDPPQGSQDLVVGAPASAEPMLEEGTSLAISSADPSSGREADAREAIGSVGDFSSAGTSAISSPDAARAATGASAGAVRGVVLDERNLPVPHASIVRIEPGRAFAARANGVDERATPVQDFASVGFTSGPFVLQGGTPAAPADSSPATGGADAAATTSQPVRRHDARGAVDHGRGIRIRAAGGLGVRDRTVFMPRRLTASASVSGADDSFFPVREPAKQLAQSDHQGRFEIAASALSDGVSLRASADGHVPVLGFFWYGNDPDAGDVVLVVSGPAPVAGLVVDEQDRPIAGAEVCVRLPDDLEASFDGLLGHAVLLEYFATTGPEGRFEIAEVPGIEGRHIVARREGYAERGQPLASDRENGVRLVLPSAQDFHASARGVVVDAQGTPVARASIRLGHQNARSDRDGRFVVDATLARAGDEILASTPGFVPARASYDPASVETLLRLGPPTLRFSGVVLDEQNRPIPRVEIRALGLTRVDGQSLEELSTKDAHGPFVHGDTDDDGLFEIGGLAPRSYTLGLLDRRTLRFARVGPIQAGSTREVIHFPSEERLGRIAGRVVGRDGAPVAGAEVHLLRVYTPEDGTHVARAELFTRGDADGGFDFRGVAIDVQVIRVAWPGGMSREYAVAGGTDLERLTLVAYRSANLRIDASASDASPDAFEVLDTAGGKLEIAKIEGDTTTSTTRWPLVRGRSETLAALDAAETVLLCRGDEVVARIPVRLVPGEITIVRP